MLDNIKNIAFVALITFFCGAVNAQQQTPQKSLEVKVKLNSACVIAAENINFGPYNPNSNSDYFAMGALNVRCSKNAPITMGLNLSGPISAHPPGDKYAFPEGGTYARYMRGEQQNKLFYNLFQDAAFSKVWGGKDWFVHTSSARPTFIGTGQLQVIPIYGAMSAKQYVRPGVYSDTITAYVDF